MSILQNRKKYVRRYKYWCKDYLKTGNHIWFQIKDFNWIKHGCIQYGFMLTLRISIVWHKKIAPTWRAKNFKLVTQTLEFLHNLVSFFFLNSKIGPNGLGKNNSNKKTTVWSDLLFLSLVSHMCHSNFILIEFSELRSGSY